MPPPAEAPPRHNRRQTHRAPEGVYARARNNEQTATPTQPEPRPLMTIEVAKQQLADAILKHDVVVLRAGTGSGKSTVAPTIALEALQKVNPRKRVKMMVAEPRQNLAEDASKRVAELNGVSWGGDLVGYYHGDGQKYSREQTQIVFTVSGSLKNRIKEDLSLAEWDAIVLDEIHLRDADQEAILIGFKEVQKRRKARGLAPLKFLIISAGAKQEHADYYDNAFMLDIPGAEPKYKVVKEDFLTEPIDFKDVPIKMGQKAAEIIQDRTHYGDVVGFLPGEAEIKAAQAEFDRIMREKGLSYKSASLMGGGGEANKATRAILGDKNPERQPIVAFVSAVGETGATFARLTKVIDSGQSRVMVYDHESGLERLETVGESYDDYLQRLGRLARTGNGEYYGMFPEADLEDESKHPKESVPSIIREDIVPLLLSLKTMGIIDVHNVDYIDHPGVEKLDKAIQTLTLLGALNPDGTLTQVGQDMEKLPYDPHFARMLVEAKKRGCVEAVSTLIGFLNSHRSVFAYNPRIENFADKYDSYIHSKSDYLTLLNVWNAYVNNFENPNPNGVKLDRSAFSPHVFEDVETTKSDILQDDFFGGFDGGLGNIVIDIEAQKDKIIACIIAGFRDKLLKKSGNGYEMVYGVKKGILPDRSSVLAKHPAAMVVSGDIRTPLNGRVTYAGMNQEVTQELLDAITPYAVLEALRSKNSDEEEKVNMPVQQSQQHTPGETSRRQGSQSPAPSATEERSQGKKPFFVKAILQNTGKAIQVFVAKINQAAANFFARIRKFLGGK